MAALTGLKAVHAAERQAEIDGLLLAIAKENLLVSETLETRNSDSLDFHDVSVGNIKAALRAAFAAGARSAKGGR